VVDDVARRRGLVVGAEAVAVEVAHVAAAERVGGQPAQGIVVDLIRAQLRPKAEDLVAAQLLEQAAEARPPGDLLHGVDLGRAGGVGEDAHRRLADAVQLPGFHAPIVPEVARKNSARAAPNVAVAVGAGAAAAPVRAADAPTTEVGIVPLVGGDSDNGIGFGALSTVARLDPAARPYEWKVDAGAFISFKVQDRTLVVPYLDAYFEVTIPQFLSDRLRLDVRPSFTRETTQRYFGLGNASPAPDPIVPARDQYARVHPSLRTRLRLLLAGQFFWEVGASYTENWLDIDPASTLAMQMSAGTPVERDLLGTAA